jgi:Ca-activated chloride channel family protein
LRTGLLCWVPDFSLDDYAYLFRLPTSINRMTCLIYRPTSSLICGWLAVVLLALAPFAISQVSSSTTQSREPQYTYHANVAEVAITFHASDAQGLPVNDLKHGEVTVFDNGVPQTMILSFQVFQDHAIRAGIIFDTSKSIENSLVQNRAIATLFAQRILRQQSDQAFVEEFGYVAKVTQPWIGDPKELTTGIRNVVAGKENPLGGTALFDTVFQACYSEFGKAGKASGKFILLFTDGEDNASHTDLKDVVDMCQQSNTAIYAFRPEAGLGFSDGPRTLLELTAKTGGCVFHADDSEPEIDKDLGIIEGNLRNQYLLSYHPLALKHDGSFHHIELRGPERVDKIGVRSGYYDRKDSPTELPQNGFIL